MNDLVKDLRQPRWVVGAAQTCMTQAADEIERLRMALAMAKTDLLEAIKEIERELTYRSNGEASGLSDDR